MNKGTFAYALTNIDDEFVCLYAPKHISTDSTKLIRFFKKRKETIMTSEKTVSRLNHTTNIKWKQSKPALIIAAFLVCVMCAIAVIPAFLNNNHSNLDKDNQPQLHSVEILSGYNEEAVGKPLPSQRIALKCMSSYSHGEKIIVDAAMGDAYSDHQKWGSFPSFDTFEANGYPIFDVYSVNTTNHEQMLEDNNLHINGSDSKYSRIFTREDMSKLDISGEYGNISQYYHESVELDLSEYDIGSSGCIAFSFGWYYEKENPNNENSLSLWEGQRKFIYFFVGENGFVFNFDSCEAAEKYYYENGTTSEEQTNVEKEGLCAAKPLYLIPLNRNEMSYEHGSIIEKTFKLCSNVLETQYNVEVTAGERVKLLSETNFIVDITDDNIISVIFQLSDDSFEETISLVISDQSPVENMTGKETVFYQSIFCYHEGEKDYVSVDSLDSLAVYSEELTNRIDMINNLGLSFDNAIGEDELDEVIDGVNSTCTAKGYIKWTDSSGNIHPAQGVTVYVYKGSTNIGSATTSSTGYYSKSFSTDGTSQSVKIKVYSSGTNIAVKDSSNTTYVYESPASTGTTSVSINYTASNSSNKGKSLCVHQAMALANRYIYSLDSAYLSTINVAYPNSSMGTSCYVSSENKIYVLAGDAFDWDVLEHEYGHYVQDHYNIENSPGGDHSSTQNLADALENKSDGIYLAWGEGWATYFAINLQNKMNANALGIPNVGDTSYQDTDDATIDYSIEYLSVSRRLGEANEATVAAVMFDITDPIDTSEEDNIYCNNSTIWNITKNNNCKNLSQFINAFYNSTFSMSTRLSLGSTLSRYKVAAYLYAPTNITTSTPTFSWVKQGGSTNYPNNSFKLAFYNSSYSLITRIDCGNVTSKTLTATQWNTIKAAGSTIYCCVEAKQTSSPSTGPYYSNLRTISLSTAGTYKITNVGAGKCLNVYGDNVTSLYNHQNVCLWSDSGTNEQKWYVTSIGSGVYIKSVIDTSYGLNVYRVGSPWNCDLYPISGNETDAQVDFIAVTGGYKIKLHNYDLYLTASASSNGSNVYWSAASTSTYQVWSLTSVS